jgi:hypothetical protein
MKETEQKFVKIKNKEEFIKMTNVLNKFYSLHKETEDLKVRKELCKEPLKSLTIKVNHIRNYEFMVTMKSKNVESTWIHVDGIMEERDSLKEKGFLDHPVFNIICLTDLYKESLV